MQRQPLYTIGYGARDIDAFVDVLRRHGIVYLIDVRSRPYSRYKPDFSKDSLDAHLRAGGIRYVFMGDQLGGRPDDPDTRTPDDHVDYDRLATRPYFLAGIERLKKAAAQDEPVILMCSEGKPEACHRSKLIGRVLAAAGVTVAHIDEDGELVDQETVEARLMKGQPSLPGFDLRPTTSRKPYTVADEDEDE